MSGYLEEYGAGEEKKENLVRNSILISLAAVVLSVLLIYLLRTYHQVGITKNFLAHVKAKDYTGAYTVWSCAASHSCRDYTYQKFLEDWGPNSSGANNPILKITDSETCGKGVILTVNVAPERQEKLFVERGSDGLSFFPLPVCPGKGPWAIMMHRTVGRLRQAFY